MRRYGVLLAAAVWLAVSRADAQSSIPDGVFVRESNGTTWLVLNGQRIGVPIWQATDADIATLPMSDQWAVLSVNDLGAMVAGARPSWMPAQDAAQAAAIAPSTSIDFSTQKGAVSAGIAFSNFGPDSREFTAVVLVRNGSARPLQGVKLTWQALDESGAIVGSRTMGLPDLPSTDDTPIVIRGTAGLTGAPRSINLFIADEGKPGNTVRRFEVEPATLTQSRAGSATRRTEVRVSSTLRTGDQPLKSSSVGVIFVLRADDGTILGGQQTELTWLSAPADLAPNTRYRIESYSLSVDRQPATAQVIVFPSP